MRSVISGIYSNEKASTPMAERLQDIETIHAHSPLLATLRKRVQDQASLSQELLARTADVIARSRQLLKTLDELHARQHSRKDYQ